MSKYHYFAESLLESNIVLTSPKKIKEQKAKISELEEQLSKEASNVGLIQEAPRHYVLYINGKSVTVRFKLEQFKTVSVSINIKDDNYKLFNLIRTDSLKVEDVGEFVRKLKDAGKKLQLLKETLEEL